jgi:hypothetical protein
MEATPKVLLIKGGEGGGGPTKSPAFDVLPPTIVTELFHEPELVPVTFTEMEQGEPNVIDPLNEIWLLPALAETPPPHPLLITAGGLATTRPNGKKSVNSRSVDPKIVEVSILKVSVVVPPNGIEVSANIFWMEG